MIALRSTIHAKHRLKNNAEVAKINDIAAVSIHPVSNYIDTMIGKIWQNPPDAAIATLLRGTKTIADGGLICIMDKCIAVAHRQLVGVAQP